MKKTTVIIAVVAVALLLGACNSKGEEPITESSTMATTSQTTGNESSSLATSPSEKKSKTSAAALKNQLKEKLGENESSGMFVSENGHFTYQNIRDASFVYAEERSSSREKEATKTASDIVSILEEYYGDMSLSKKDFKDIGSGENGIDSVLYNFYYTSPNGGEVRIQIDSDAVVSFIQSGCSFV